MPSRGNLGLVHALLGGLVGCVVTLIAIGGSPWQPTEPRQTASGGGSIQSLPAQPTTPLVVNAVLTLPTATATVRPQPTAKAQATAAVELWTGQTRAGIFQMPPATSVPPTPLPVCHKGLEPKAWCQVPETGPMVAGVRNP